MAQAGLSHAAGAAQTKKGDGEKERPKQVKGLEFWCPLCFNFRRDRLFERHLKPGICPALRKDMAEEEWKGLVAKAKTELRSGLDSIAPNMYFNPNNIPDRLYSKADVCHILERWGHQSIPENFRDTAVARGGDPKKAAHVTFCFKDAADASQRRGPEPLPIQPLVQLPPETPIRSEAVLEPQVRPGTYVHLPIPEGNQTVTSETLDGPVTYPVEAVVRVVSPPLPGPSAIQEDDEEAGAITPPGPSCDSQEQDDSSNSSSDIPARPATVKRRLVISSSSDGLRWLLQGNPDQGSRPTGIKGLDSPRILAKSS